MRKNLIPVANEVTGAIADGDRGKVGFQTIPDVLLKNQSKLGLSPTDMLVLLNVTMGWYRSERPFPRSTTIAGRMGVGVRTVQRALATLRKLGVLAKVGSSPAEVTPESRIL